MKETKMPTFRRLRKLFSRSPPRAPPTLASAPPSSPKEQSDTAATSAANIAVDPPSTPSTTLAGVVQSNSTVRSPAAASSLGSVPLTPALPTNNATSNPTVSSAPSCAETSQANSTSLGPVQPGSSSSSSPSADILKSALEQLKKKDRVTVEEYMPLIGTNADTAITDALEAAKKKQKECIGNGWHCNIGGHEVRLRDVADKVVKWVDLLTPIGDAAASLDPIHAGLPWAGVKVLIEISVADQHQMAALLSGLNTVLYIANRFKVYYTFIAQISEGQARTNFKTALIDLQEHSFLRHLKAIWGSEATSSFDSECNEISKRAEVEAHNCGRSLILDMREKLKSLEDVKESVAKLLSEFELSKLTLVEGASFDSHDEEYNSLCLDNTRVGLRLQIAQWVNDPHGKCIFWLNGMAGTGKSTISRTIARAFRDKDQLGASFFFKRGESDRNDARKLFTTIAAQLSYSLPAIVPSILDAIKSGYAISGKALKEQFENLILGPLHTVPERRSAVVIVIDALDECENEADMKNTLCLLARLEELKLVRLRIFLTSRPEKGIIDTFLDIRGDEYPDVALEGIPTTQKDLSAYFTNEFAKMKRKPIRDGPNWPGDVVIGELARMAEPSFIFAATICRFVNDEDESPERQLEIMRGSKFASSQASQLDQTYLPVLNQLKRNPRLEKQYHTLLETIVLLADPLSAPALAALLKTDEMDLEIIRLRLQRLHSVLRIPANEVSPVRIFHLSFREFLVDPQKRDKHWFWVDEQEAHERIARKCLELMSRDGALKRNPCGFKEPGVARSEVDRRVVDEHLSSEVQYACRYWVYHVEKSNGQFSDVPAVLVFLQTHLLHWFEALSWMDRISEGVTMIITLRSLFDTYGNNKLTDFLYDAYRFLLSYRLIADSSPLQLYSSALIFAPKASIIRNLFQKEIDWIGVPLGVEQNWSPTLQILDDHSRSVSSVVFSPDGSKLASGSGDCTVRVWDSATGQVKHTLEGHSKSVRSVIFSPDGSKLASGSVDHTIQVWDIATGHIKHTLEGHSGWISRVIFSLDGNKLASGSGDCTVRVWDVATGQVKHSLEGYLDTIGSIVFSPDGSKLASGSGDRTVRVWDVATGQVKYTLEGHSGSTSSVVFSPDGSKLASGSEDCTVRVWDVATGHIKHTLEGHSGWVNSVVFSPDGSKLVSGSFDRTMRVWDVATRQVKHTLEGYSGSVNSIVFSPDGSKLVSGSSDRTVRVWDVAKGQVKHTLEGHSGSVNSVVFSPDGSKLASGSEDHTVRVWDAEIGQVEHMQGHSNSVDNIVFSPDRSKLASGSEDCTVRVWDVATGHIKHILEGHSGRVSSIAFSPDGSKFASGSSDCTVRVWDIATGKIEHTFKGHSKWVGSVIFSSGGSKLASGSEDHTIQVWDIATGQVKYTLEGHSSWVSSIVFSPDGSKLASGSGDCTVRVWDIATGKIKHTLKGHLGVVSSVMFSPDGSRLASGSRDCTVRVWDIVMGQLEHTFKGHSKNWVDIIVFSPDGSKLASGSEDHTIQVWDIATGQVNHTLEGHSGSVNSIVFSPDGSKPDSCQLETIHHHVQSRSFYSVDKSGYWVTQNGSRILNLPMDHRPGCVATEGSNLAIGSSTGRVTIITFYSDVKT